MRFDGKTTKQVATKVNMDELSGVTQGAHAGALVGIIKTDDVEEMRKNLFLQAVENMELADEIYDIIWKVWDYTDALYDVAMEIVYNLDKYPNPGEAFAEVLKSFAGLVSTLKKNEKDEEAITAVTDFVKADKLTVLKIVRDSKQADSAANPSKEIETMKTKDELAAELVLKKAADDDAILMRLTALSKMSDKQKSHNDSLSDKESVSFLKMDSAAMDTAIADKEAGNELVYVSKSTGHKFYESDDVRMVDIAKQADESAEKSSKLEKAAEVTRLEKQAETEMGALPGEIEVKVALLKAIDAGITDVVMKGKVMKMVNAQNKGHHKAEEIQGHNLEKIRGDANQELDSMVKAHATDNKISYNDALSAVCETEEGLALYEQIS